MAQLIWTGTDEQEQFHDDRRNVTYWPSDRPSEVPDAVADRYLEHEGWTEAEDDDGVSSEEVIEEHDRARARENEQEGEGESEEVVLQSESESEPEPEPETNGGETDGTTPEEVGYGEGGFHAASEPERSESTADGPDGSGSEATEGIVTSGESDFDADQFIDGNWQAVASAIREGDADDHLAAVETAERQRDGGPRENSVLRAIKDRRSSTQETDTADADAESGD